VPVARDPFALAQSLIDCLAERDAQIFDQVVGVDVQITPRLDIQVNQPMPCDLLEHVFEKSDADIKVRCASAV
jgi:hypothetical protein